MKTTRRMDARGDPSSFSDRQVRMLVDGEWQTMVDLAAPPYNAFGITSAVWGRAATDLYVGTADGSLFHFDGETWDSFAGPGGLIGSIWGADGELFVIDNTGVWRRSGSGWVQVAAKVLPVGLVLATARLSGTSAEDYYARTGDELIHYQRGRVDRVRLAVGGVAALDVTGPWHAFLGIGGVVSAYSGVSMTEVPVGGNSPGALWSASPDRAFFASNDGVSLDSGFGFYSLQDGVASRLARRRLPVVASVS